MYYIMVSKCRTGYLDWDSQQVWKVEFMIMNSLLKIECRYVRNIEMCGLWHLKKCQQFNVCFSHIWIVAEFPLFRLYEFDYHNYFHFLNIITYKYPIAVEYNNWHGKQYPFWQDFSYTQEKIQIFLIAQDNLSKFRF